MDRSAAYIDLKSLEHNYKLLQTVGSQQHQVMAVVKANAYGHGAIQVSNKLESIGCTHFGVACLQEAIELRNNKISSMILIFGRTNPKEAKILSKQNLTQSIHSLQYAIELSEQGYQIDVHLNVDTGMSRYGFYCQNPESVKAVADEIEKINGFPNLNIKGIYTHFISAESFDHSHTEKQFKLFSLLMEELKIRNIDCGIKHVCNSSATIQNPEMHLDMVRCGIALYGYPPLETNLVFEPVMTLAAKVTDIRIIQPGDSVSYGAKYIADTKMKVATISIGYADGYPRGLTNNDFVLFRKHKLKILGTVCMDAIMVDATGTNIKIDSEVICFGKEKSVEIIAKKTGTISYEILCNIGQRVKRIYMN